MASEPAGTVGARSVPSALPNEDKGSTGDADGKAMNGAIKAARIRENVSAGLFRQETPALSENEFADLYGGQIYSNSTAIHNSAGKSAVGSVVPLHAIDEALIDGEAGHQPGSLLDISRPISLPSAQIDPNKSPQGVAGPQSGEMAGQFAGRQIYAQRQYGPLFATPEAAVEFARLGQQKGWFGTPDTSLHSKGAVVLQSKDGYAVYEADLPRGFSIQDPPTLAPNTVSIGTIPAPSAGDIAANLDKLHAGPSLTAVITRERLIGDYRGGTGKAQYSGLDGDPASGKVELLGVGLEAARGDLQVIGDAVTHAAQSHLDRAERATQTMLSYTTDKGLTPDGENIIGQALNDTKDINHQIIAKQKLFAEQAKQLEELAIAQDRRSLQDRLNPQHTDFVPPNTDSIMFRQAIQEQLNSLYSNWQDIRGLYAQRTEILKDNNAEFLARYTPEQSLELTDKINSNNASVKSEAATQIYEDANDVLKDVQHIRQTIISGDFKWTRYDALINQTAVDLGFNGDQYQQLSTQLADIRKWEARAELAEGALSLGLALVPGAGWVATGARIGSLALSANMFANELDAYRTDRSLANTQIDPQTVENIFASQGAPSEIGLALAAIAIVPDAAFLIGKTMSALRPGEKISPEAIDRWIKSSPHATNPTWVRGIQDRFNQLRGFYNSSGISIRHVNRDALRQLTQEDRALAVFHVSKGENGVLRGNIVVADDLKWSERSQALSHENVIHAEQLAASKHDPVLRGNFEKLADLETRWPGMQDPAARRAVKNAQIDIEIDARTRELGRATSAVQRNAINGHIAELQAERRAVQSGAYDAMSAPPPFLFAKRPKDEGRYAGLTAAEKAAQKAAIYKTPPVTSNIPTDDVLELHSNYLSGVPFTWKENRFRHFVNKAYEHFNTAGYNDVRLMMQGSGASGERFLKDQKAFIKLDSKKGDYPDDYDIAIVSPSLSNKAIENNIDITKGPLSPNDINILGLGETQRELTLASKGQRPVNFKVYLSVEDAYDNQRTIPFSKWR